MFAGLKKLQNKMMIKRKLLLINMIVAILPVVTFGVLITSVYEDTVNKRTRQSVGDSSVVIADRITRVLKDTENCSNYLTVNINKVMDSKTTTENMTLSEQKAITNELYVAQIVFDEISSIAFISMDQKVFISDNTLQSNTEALLASEQLFTLKDTSGKSIWFPCEKRDFLVRDTTEPVLTLGKKVLHINSGATLGYLFLNVDISKIENNLVNQLINYRLVDENGTVVSSVVSSKHIVPADVDELLDDLESNVVKKYRGRRYFISNYSIEDYGWNLMGITDLNEYNLESKKILYLITIIAVAAVFLEVIISNYLSRIITVPLLKLKNGAEEIAGGNMKLRFSFKSEDEIGQLGNSFNYMTEQVQELLEKVDYEACKKREYELSLLQEQVKPHFLYNSLDIIIKLSEMNRHNEARRAVRRLADYYRNSLSDSKEIITIRQEIQIVEDYLELQKIRYKDLFTYKVTVDEKVMMLRIPKLTLQPIIENAIYHGIKYKEEAGMIRINGSIINDCVVLSVEDNGAGISRENSVAILLNNPEGHFGLYSVNHRIMLFYGEEYGIMVHSRLGEGTRIDVILPANGSNS